MPEFDFFFEYEESHDAQAHTDRKTKEFPDLPSAVAWAGLMCITSNDEEMTYEDALEEMGCDDDYPASLWDDRIRDCVHPASCSVAPHVEATEVDVGQVYAKFARDLTDLAKATREETELETLKKLAKKYGKKIT